MFPGKFLFDQVFSRYCLG